MGGFKTRTKGSAAQIGNTYKEEDRVSQYGAKRKASGVALTPQNRSVDSMKAPVKNITGKKEMAQEWKDLEKIHEKEPAWKQEVEDHPQLSKKEAQLIAKQEREKKLRENPEL